MTNAPCPVCGKVVVTTDNNVRLDVPAVAYDEVAAPWTIMQVGPRYWASVGNPSPEGTGHALHEHQPEEAA